MSDEYLADSNAEFARENAALRHDIDRYLNINSELATENAALRKRVEELKLLLKPVAFCAEPNRPATDSVLLANGHAIAAKAALEDK